MSRLSQSGGTWRRWTTASATGERFPWSPERVTTLGDLGVALREMRDRSGLGYKALEVKGKRLAQAGTVRAELGQLAANPLPNSSLHRAIETHQVRWFAAAPGRLEVFLRIVGCPEAELAGWLAKLRELTDSALARAEPDRPPAAPRPGGRWRRWLAAAAIAVGVIFLLVLASYARFYAALGLELSELPLSIGSLAAATFVVTLLAAAAGVLVVGAFAAGAAMVPWGAPTRAATPAAAFAIVLGVGGYVGWIAVPFPGAEFAVAALAMVVCGAQFRLLIRQRPVSWLTGWAIGLAATAIAVAAAVTVGRWSGSRLWLLATLITGTAAALFALHRWMRRELRRAGLDERSHTTPAAVLAQLRAELLPPLATLLQPRMTAGQARRFVAATALLMIMAAALAVGVVVYLVDTAADAGRAAREYGYVPPGHGSLVWLAPVRPATVIPRGEDPLQLCEAPSAWSVSLIAYDGDASWVLLRPRGPNQGTTQVARLSVAEYAVRPVLDSDIRNGEPWTGAACK